MRATDLAWLVGLWEGEGSFGLAGAPPRLRMQIEMNDRDIIERVARLMGRRAYNIPRRPRVWRVDIYGAEAGRWMRKMHRYLGARRRARITEVIQLCS